MAQTDDLNFDKTSGLNKYAICAYCGNKFANKTALVSHVNTCVYNRTCRFCDKTFKNRGILVNHSLQQHGKFGNVLKGSHVFPCTACTGTYKHPIVLKNHIRNMHYNMVAMVTEGETRNINDVWYERVLNSDELVQITKRGPNSYLMKRTKDLGHATCSQKDPVDLSLLYPSRRYQKRSYCKICRRTFLIDIRTHLKAVHPDVDIERLFSHVSDIWNKQNQCLTSETITID